MKELVEVIAKSLVDHPDEVVVTETEKEDAVIVELKVGTCRYGQGNRTPGTHCKSNPYCSKSGIFKRRQKSDCGYSAMKIITERSCGCHSSLFLP